MSDGVHLEFEYPALPARLWDTLTNETKLASWFMPNDLVPVVGHRFTLHPDRTAALAGPLHGLVVEVDAPRLLVLELRSGPARARLTWQVEAARGGSRLRVVHAGDLGDPDALRREYGRLFGDRLLATLRAGLLARMSPSASPASSEAPSSPPAANAAATPGHEPARSDGDSPVRSMSLPLRTGPAESIAVPATPTPKAGPSRRSYQPRLSVAVLTALGIAVAVFAFAQVIPEPAGPAAGTLEITSNPVAGGAVAPGQTHPTAAATPPSEAGGPGGPGGPGGGPAPTRTGAAGPTAGTGPSAGPTSIAGTLTVSYQTQPGLLSTTVTVSLHNNAATAQPWTAVRVHYDGVNIKLGQVSASVQVHTQSAASCFFPAAGHQTIGPGATLTFTFTIDAVSGLLSKVSSVTLEQTPCPA